MHTDALISARLHGCHNLESDACIAASLPPMRALGALLQARHNTLLSSYIWAGAYIIGVPASVDPQPHNGTFWRSLPGGPGLFWPMFIVALLAAIVASQALISAVFQITYQAIAQGFFPRFHVYHKSREHKGQVQSPACTDAAAYEAGAGYQQTRHSWDVKLQGSCT